MTYQVLVAGDDVETKVVIKKALAELEGGIEVIVVENTGQAIERFSSTAFDLVIVDVCEPVTDSIEAVKVIHMSEPDLPILVYTGVGGDDIKTGALKAGANVILSKPVDIKELKGEIKRLLDIQDKG